MREVFLALCFCLIFEGLILAASPARLRQALLVLSQYPDKTLRLIGGFAAALGALCFILMQRIPF